MLRYLSKTLVDMIVKPEKDVLDSTAITGSLKLLKEAKLPISGLKYPM